MLLYGSEALGPILLHIFIPHYINWLLIIDVSSLVLTMQIVWGNVVSTVYTYDCTVPFSPRFVLPALGDNMVAIRW